MTTKDTQLKLAHLEAFFRMSKKTIQEYVQEIERHCRYKSSYHCFVDGVILDDRSRLMDLYDACIQQDIHLAGVLETLFSQILGERYMLARQNSQGRYVKDLKATKKIQGTQFIKIIRGIVQSQIYGYTGLYISPEINPNTGNLARVDFIERRNILADQRRIVKRQGIWNPGWSFDDPRYRDNYILINTEGLGLGSAFTPSILAKKFTVANYVNFSHTYGQPIIHGKTEADNESDRQSLADEIASAAQKKIVITGLNDEIDIKNFTGSNSEQVFMALISFVDKSVSNLILGSESVAGETQAYAGSAKTHENVFRDRIEVYRNFIELVMNEEIIPRLVKMGYIEPGLEFRYSKRIEMSDEDKIKLYDMIAKHFNISPDVIDDAFGVKVIKQITPGDNRSGLNQKTESKVVNFLRERQK